MLIIFWLLLLNYFASTAVIDSEALSGMIKWVPLKTQIENSGMIPELNRFLKHMSSRDIAASCDDDGGDVCLTSELKAVLAQAETLLHIMRPATSPIAAKHTDEILKGPVPSLDGLSQSQEIHIHSSQPRPQAEDFSVDTLIMGC